MVHEHVPLCLYVWVREREREDREVGLLLMATSFNEEGIWDCVIRQGPNSFF